jgi:HPt (histidine-containing phosphotransfer) domain-containing protein
MDPIVLNKFRADLDGFEVWSAFVQNFLSALPLRIENLRLTLTTGDAVGAMDAVLSLKTASQMVGASRLSALAHGLEMAQREAIRVAKPSAVLPRLAVNHLPRIKQRAQQTSYVLEAHLEAAGRPQTVRMRPLGAPDRLLGIP